MIYIAPSLRNPVCLSSETTIGLDTSVLSRKQIQVEQNFLFSFTKEEIASYFFIYFIEIWYAIDRSMNSK